MNSKSSIPVTGAADVEQVDQTDFNHAPGRKQPAKSHLYYVELASGRVVRLDNAMRVANLDEFGCDNYLSVCR